jgi:hypothetical protein
MASNVIHLPRPLKTRPKGKALGLFIRVGRNDHLEMLELLAAGERGIFGFVIDAHNVGRHRDLIVEAKKRNFDVILDPKFQQLALPGSHTEKLAELPWGRDRHHVLADFDSTNAKNIAGRLVEFALENGFTEILGPSHLLTGPNDPWLRRDIQAMAETAREIAACGQQLDLIYSLAVPIDVLRNRSERQALAASVADAPCNAVWLKIENFGDDASGEKTAAYVEICRDFHQLGLPIVSDHAGGLPGMAALAFGAVGGIAHGVTMNQSFKASSWRKPTNDRSGGGQTWRVYIPQLDLLMKPADANSFLNTSPRLRSKCGCRDTHCCPHGVRDMIERPARHALYQRAREVQSLSNLIPSVRVAHFIEERARRVSDDVAAVAALPGIQDSIRDKLLKKQARMGRFRQAMVHLAEAAPPETRAEAPLRREERESHG